MKFWNSLCLGLGALGVLPRNYVGVEGNMLLMDIIAENAIKLEKEGLFQDEKPDSVLGEPQDCVDGTVVLNDEVFDCSEVDFLSYLSLKDLEIPELGHPVQFRSMDIWGWLSPSGKEVTIITLDNGQAVVDTTDPVNPCIIAKLPTGRFPDRWGDNKVYQNTLYHVKDRGGGDRNEQERTYGVEVYDLLQFDDMECSDDPMAAPYVDPDFVMVDHGRSHNLVINTESGLLYSVGTEKCEGGLFVMDLKPNRLEPQFLACVESDGYTHDAQCVTYDGPDQDHQGKEICFAFNEDTLTIWDVTDVQNAVMLSRTLYPNQVYSHQGWTNNDLTKVLLDDELDERCNNDDEGVFSYCEFLAAGNLTGVRTTSTNVFNIVDLDAPFLEGAYIHDDFSIDHNLYVWGQVHRKGWGGNPAMEYYPDPSYAYLNNYLAGVRILDIRSDDMNDWFEAGFFDVSPDRTSVDFAGVWSGYMHPSGVYAASSIERGLFLLKPRMAFTDEYPQAPAPTELPTEAPVASPVAAPVAAPVEAPAASPAEPENGSSNTETLALLLASTLLVISVAAFALLMKLCCMLRSSSQSTAEVQKSGSPIVGTL